MMKIRGIDTFLYALLFSGCVVAIVLAVYHSYTIPTVQISHTTDECVQVIPVGTCDKLPEKYIVEWVR